MQCVRVKLFANGTVLWKCCKVERTATGSGVCGYFESGDLFIMQPHSALGYESNWIWRRSVYNAASPARAEVCFGAVPPFPVCVMPLCTVWHYVCVLALCTMWSLCGTMWRLCDSQHLWVGCNISCWVWMIGTNSPHLLCSHYPMKQKLGKR